jgi:hypothetical protein
MLVPGSASYNRAVPTPVRLFRIEIARGAPSSSRRISKTEKGRRSSGSVPRDGFSITNCPGCALAAMGGASSTRTL